MTTFFRRLLLLPLPLASRRRSAARRSRRIASLVRMRWSATARTGGRGAREPAGMGNVALAVEDARDVWAVRTVDSCGRTCASLLRGLAQEPGLRARGHRHARARHRRQHGAVLDLQQPDPAPAAGARSRQPRAAHQRDLVLSDLEEIRPARPSCSTARSHGPPRASTCRPGGQTRPGGRRVRQRPALRRARRHRHPRPA